MKLTPNFEKYADKKLQPIITEQDSVTSNRTFNKKDIEALPGIPEAEVHFYYYSSLERSDVRKEDRCGR